MDPGFRAALVHSGAVLDPPSGTPASFGDPGDELERALKGCVVADRSDLGRSRATGKDILDLLHRLSTADLRGLGPGEGRPTVLTTAKGRIVERLFVHHLGQEGVLLVSGTGNADAVLGHLRRYTFAEETGLADVTEETCQIALIGPDARRTAAAAGIPAPPPFGARSFESTGIRVHALGEDGSSADGISLFLPAARAAEFWLHILPRLRDAGAAPAGALALEAWRVLRGHPGSGAELHEGYNPLEAGLLDHVSFAKGCYVGQEVVARLRTYDKVGRGLVGLVLPEGAPVPAAGTPIIRDARQVGEITSALVPPGRKRAVALAYLKRGEMPGGATVRVGTGEDATEADISPLPFA